MLQYVLFNWKCSSSYRGR